LKEAKEQNTGKEDCELGIAEIDGKNKGLEKNLFPSQDDGKLSNSQRGSNGSSKG